MSRGLGYVQRTILEYLSTQQHASADAIVRHVYRRELGKKDTPSPAMSISVRRALAGLVKDEMAGRIFDYRLRVWHWLSIENYRVFRKREESSERTRARKESKKREASRLARIEESRGISVLAKILGMLGSEHDGEALTAARRAEDQRRKLGMTWAELLAIED
jgi:hypothetical protein